MPANTHQQNIAFKFLYLFFHMDSEHVLNTLDKPIAGQ